MNLMCLAYGPPLPPPPTTVLRSGIYSSLISLSSGFRFRLKNSLFNDSVICVHHSVVLFIIFNLVIPITNYQLHISLYVIGLASGGNDRRGSISPLVIQDNATLAR